MKISLAVLSLLVFAEMTTSKKHKEKEKKKKETKFNYYPVKDVQGNVIFSKI